MSTILHEADPDPEVLYLIARVLGDINAAAKGRIAQRAARRAAGKLTGRLPA